MVSFALSLDLKISAPKYVYACAWLWGSPSQKDQGIEAVDSLYNSFSTTGRLGRSENWS